MYAKNKSVVGMSSRLRQAYGAAAGPSAGRDRVLAIRRSRSPEPSQIKGENTPLASRTPSRRAGTRALPVRVLDRLC
jgi:hypothetical protein